MKDQKNKSKVKKKENVKKVESEKDKAYKINKEEQYKKLEAYISESGLTLAFNIIFAELISKQILPENFFAYTSMRLKQIGKEIEGMKTKITPEEKPNNEEEQKINTLRGTELYMSPALYEGLKQGKNDVSHDPFKSDVFSLGFCLLYASTLNFELLYEARDNDSSDMIKRILNKSFFKKVYSDKLIKILYNMLLFDESKRFSFQELLKFIDDHYGKK